MADLTRKQELERRAARESQERIENMREIADAMYHWNAQALISEKCMLLPGDICICGQGGLEGSRVALVGLSPEAITDLIDRGALSKIFDPDDLNAPDFGDKMGAILHELQSQRHFHDASCFYHAPELGRAVAVYDVPGPTPEQDVTISVERHGERFEILPSVRADVGTMAQCTYAEFNPGGRDILEQLNADGQERQNRSENYRRLMEAYQDGGSNDVPEAGEVPREEPVKPEDIAGYDEMSPSQKLRMQTDYLNAKDAYDRQDQDEDDFGPRLPGQRRGMH